MIMTSPINNEGGGDGNNDGDYEKDDENNDDEDEVDSWASNEHLLHNAESTHQAKQHLQNAEATLGLGLIRWNLDSIFSCLHLWQYFSYLQVFGIL